MTGSSTCKSQRRKAVAAFYGETALMMHCSFGGSALNLSVNVYRSSLKSRGLALSVAKVMLMTFLTRF
jgi:hypothetical protein